MIPRVHIVTTDEVVNRPDFRNEAARLMRRLGARGAMHLRAPRASGARLQAVAEDLALAAAASACWLVVNDRVDVALAAGANAVQLTGRSLTPADGRRIAPRLRIGASVHDAAEAHDAARAGADWIVAGHVFDTASHPGEPGRGLAFLDAAVAAGLPTIAIGGIRPHHVPILCRHHAHGIAVIRGIWETDDAEHALAEYLSAYEDAGITDVGDVR